MNTLIAENEEKYPELKKLKAIAFDKKETDDRKSKAAFCYVMMVLSIDRQKKEVNKML